MRLARCTLLAAIAAVLLGSPAAADASWAHGGSGSQAAKAVTMPAGNQPTVSVSGRNATVSWSASAFPGGTAVAGYVVKRYDTSGNAQTIGSGCSGTVSALTCTENAVPAGSWKYSVTPKQSNWTGAESSQSSTATVASPSLSFSSSTTVTSLPTTLSGTIASFVTGQTVTYRLDDATSGTVLSGSLSPTPVGNGGGGSITVTIPAGTANGAHTVYAIGSSGDVASAAITVSVTYTMNSSVWSLGDASAGAAEANTSAQPAFADGRTFATGLWPTVFNNSNYVDFDSNDSLPAGFAVTGGSFNFRYAAAAAGETACFWFDVRHASDNSFIAQHGSAASPVGCVTGTTAQTFTTNLSELSTTDIANDSRIRVYGRESAGKAFTVDLATVSGSSQSTPFTLYTESYTDAAAGVATIYPWSLSGSAGAAYTTSGSWANTFSTTRYFKQTFPSYLPSSATVTGATLKEAYKSTTSGRTVCWYFETYTTGSSTPLATHGTSTAPYACNTTTAYVTDTVPLAEVNTPAKANGLIVKIYMNVSGGGTRTTDHDLAQLSVTWK